VLFLADQSG